MACRELGFSGISQAVVTAHFGFGNGTLLLDELGCYGNESSLLDCRHSGIGVHDCFSFEAAGVICSTGKRLLDLVALCQCMYVYKHRWIELYYLLTCIYSN